MAADIDAALLDRVFQPCANAVAPWTSCFGLARGALVVAVEAQALTLLWDVVRDVSAGNVILSGTAAVLTLVGAQQAWKLIMRADRQSRTGVMNFRRITLRGQRFVWLGVCTLCIAILLPEADIRAAFAALSCVAWIALIYFVSCTPLPPARQRWGRFTSAEMPSSG